jgi:hypothetical protein
MTDRQRHGAGFGRTELLRVDLATMLQLYIFFPQNQNYELRFF